MLHYGIKTNGCLLLIYLRFSGIQEEDMKHVTTRLQDVQAHLLSLFSNKTILIGHSLDSDFRALKVKLSLFWQKLHAQIPNLMFYEFHS